jgi:hypothetical protein
VKIATFAKSETVSKNAKPLPLPSYLKSRGAWKPLNGRFIMVALYMGANGGLPILCLHKYAAHRVHCILPLSNKPIQKMILTDDKKRLLDDITNELKQLEGVRAIVLGGSYAGVLKIAKKLLPIFKFPLFVRSRF